MVIVAHTQTQFGGSERDSYTQRHQFIKVYNYRVSTLTKVCLSRQVFAREDSIERLRALQPLQMPVSVNNKIGVI